MLWSWTKVREKTRLVVVSCMLGFGLHDMSELFPCAESLHRLWNENYSILENSQLLWDMYSWQKHIGCVMLSHHCSCVLSSWKLLLWWQDDPELEAIRQRRMQELMGHGGGGGVSSLIFASSHYSLYQNFGSPLSSETGDVDRWIWILPAEQSSRALQFWLYGWGLQTHFSGSFLLFVLFSVSTSE